MRLFLTSAQLELLFRAHPDVAPHPCIKADLEWLAAKGLLSVKPDGAYVRSPAGQRRVAVELEAAQRPRGHATGAGDQA